MFGGEEIREFGRDLTVALQCVCVGVLGGEDCTFVRRTKVIQSVRSGGSTASVQPLL